MTIREMIGQGLHYAWTCKSLWLFGFVVGLASGGGSGGGSGGNSGGAGVAAIPFFSGTRIALLIAAAVVVAIVAFVMRYVSEGALIEGVVQARQGRRMTMREGFGAGWAHWGVLLRIALLYIGTVIVSMMLVVIPCVIAFRAFGVLGGVAVVIPALLVAVPWLITVYLVQAFASRVAVLENRHAMDAIQKARLFLHGRIRHGLKLIVASFAGTLAIVIPGLLAIAPVVLFIVLSIRFLNIFAIFAIGGLVLLPVFVVLTAMVGTFRSSVWTIGYVTQVES